MSSALQQLIDDALLDWRDTEGRLLGERHGVGFGDEGHRPCPYGDSRRGRPMNRAAWGQVVRYWEGAVAALRAHGGPTAAHAWRACCRLRWAPLWGPQPVPVEDAVAFKTALGLERPLSSWLLLEPGAARRPLHALCAPNALVERLDAEGWLHGQASVCPATARHLVQAWEALSQPAPPFVHRADRSALWVSGLWAVLGATRRVLRDGGGPSGWSPALGAAPGAPRVLHLLCARGPGLLVREVPRFEPRWALHVWDEAPDALLALVDRCEAATGLPALDAAWASFVARGDGAT